MQDNYYQIVIKQSIPPPTPKIYQKINPCSSNNTRDGDLVLGSIEQLIFQKQDSKLNQFSRHPNFQLRKIQSLLVQFYSTQVLKYINLISESTPQKISLHLRCSSLSRVVILKKIIFLEKMYKRLHTYKQQCF